MKKSSVALIYIAAILVSASLAHAGESQQGCHLDSPKDAIHCLVKGSAEIEEANMENEYHVTASAQARRDLLFLMKRQAHRPEVKKAMSLVSSAAYIGLIAQYLDEPYLYYFVITADGQVIQVLELNTIDLYREFKDLKDLAVFDLHISAASKELKESVEYSFVEKYE